MITKQKKVLFPIRIDDTVLNSNKAWAADIRRKKHIGDFSKWRNEASYKESFALLLRDMQVEK